MTKTDNIAILLTCHNRKEKTLACLTALYNCSVPINYLFEVYLVDDDSTDGTSEAVKLKFKKVNIIQGDGNLYWNRGMHLAWETATKINDYNYYLWLNDDTYLFKEALNILISATSISDNNSIIVGSTSSRITGELTYGGFNEKGVNFLPSNEILKTRSFNGNLVLIPQKVYHMVGNLDPLFCHCIGDIDYGLRACKKGVNSYVAPGFLAHCERNKALPSWCNKEIPLCKRVQSLYSPLGNSHPYYYFRFELRHYDLLTAIKHFLSIHLRLILPNLWK